MNYLFSGGERLVAMRLSLRLAKLRRLRVPSPEPVIHPLPLSPIKRRDDDVHGFGPVIKQTNHLMMTIVHTHIALKSAVYRKDSDLSV